MVNDTSATVYGESRIMSTTMTENNTAVGILLAFSVCGVVGNAVVLYVFAKKDDRLVSTVFILALAVVDMMASFFLMPFAAYMQHIRFQTEHTAVCKLYYLLTSTNTPFSAFVMVAIAFDRYFCICHPFKRVITLQRAKALVAAVAVFAVSLGIFTAMEHGVGRLGEDEGHIAGLYGFNTSRGLLVGAQILDNSQLIQSNASDKYNSSRINTSTTHHTALLCLPVNPDSSFLWAYQKIYIALNVLCLLHVIVLYSLIYKSVITRRFKRQRQRSATSNLVNEMRNRDQNGVELSLMTSNNSLDKTESAKLQKAENKRDKERRITDKKELILIANLKTAAILLVVTLVFLIAHLPAVMMALNIVKQNIVLWYMYFGNNVANPIIYSFMNNNFRQDLRKHACTEQRRNVNANRTRTTISRKATADI